MNRRTFIDRRTFIAAASAFALQPTLHAQPAAESDLHALYSAILTDSLQLSCSGLAVNDQGECVCDWRQERLLIRNVTFSLTPGDRTRFTVLPLHRESYPPGPTPFLPRQMPYAPNARVPAELLEVFDSASQQPVPLPGPFELPVPSRMATAEDAKGFFDTHSMVQFLITVPSTPEQDEAIKRHDQNEREYGSFTAYIQLSTPLFNPSRTLALTTLRHDTGSDSIEPDKVYVFEKFNGQWRRYATPVPIGSATLVVTAGCPHFDFEM